MGRTLLSSGIAVGKQYLLGFNNVYMVFIFTIFTTKVLNRV